MMHITLDRQEVVSNYLIAEIVQLLYPDRIYYSVQYIMYWLLCYLLLVTHSERGRCNKQCILNKNRLIF